MNSNTPQRARHVKWQNIVIIFILIFMIISALPNLYKDRVDIVLTNTSTQQQTISKINIEHLLSKHSHNIDKINSATTQTTITLKDKAHLQTIETLLSKELEASVEIESFIKQGSPTWLQSLNAEPIKLGLDLSGGVLFVLDVDTEQALSNKLKAITLDIKQYAVDKRIRLDNIKHSKNHSILISFSTNQPNKQLLIEKIKRDHPTLLQKDIGNNQLELAYPATEQSKFRQEIMAQTLTTMRGRIEELGITEAVTQKQGKNKIRIELPGVHDPEEAKRIIGATASLDFYQLAEPSNAMNTFYMEDDLGRKLRMHGKAVFSGSNIENARAGQDEMGMPLVNLTLDRVGGKKMSTFSKNNVGKPMVTVFSEYYRNNNDEMIKKSKVINVATIQQQLGSQFSITNMSSPQSAQELALLLRAGSLSAPVTIVKQRSIEATLGVANINNGVKALTVGISFTVLFMAFWYRSLGFIANVALSLNLISLLGLMSLLPGAVLTLPGIAGLVLTVGMAVDTNVLIFERIKEELKRGRRTLGAIENGYKSAFSTILDANITTMITGLILYAIGYGPVKGFAIILCLGILTSMFTGVFVSKALTNFFIRNNKAKLLGVK